MVSVNTTAMPFRRLEVCGRLVMVDIYKRQRAINNFVGHC
jgi:hypothetical protein